jgi:hypothetical protein
MADIGADAGRVDGSHGVPHSWRIGVDVIAALVMLGATLFAVTSSLSTATFAETLWPVMPVLFGVVAFGLSWFHGGPNFSLWKAAAREAASWFGVYLAIRVLLHFVTIGLFTASTAGFACGVLMSVGTFLSGVHGQWRLLPVGAAMLGGTAAMAVLEHNLWLVFGIGLLGVGLVILAGRLQAMVEAR